MVVRSTFAMLVQADAEPYLARGAGAHPVMTRVEDVAAAVLEGAANGVGPLRSGRRLSAYRARAAEWPPHASQPCAPCRWQSWGNLRRSVRSGGSCTAPASRSRTLGRPR